MTISFHLSYNVRQISNACDNNFMFVVYYIIENGEVNAQISISSK